MADPAAKQAFRAFFRSQTGIRTHPLKYEEEHMSAYQELLYDLPQPRGKDLAALERHSWSHLKTQRLVPVPSPITSTFLQNVANLSQPVERESGNGNNGNTGQASIDSSNVHEEKTSYTPPLQFSIFLSLPAALTSSYTSLEDAYECLRRIKIDNKRESKGLVPDQRASAGNIGATPIKHETKLTAQNEPERSPALVSPVSRGDMQLHIEAVILHLSKKGWHLPVLRDPRLWSEKTSLGMSALSSILFSPRVADSFSKAQITSLVTRGVDLVEGAMLQHPKLIPNLIKYVLGELLAEPEAEGASGEFDTSMSARERMKLGVIARLCGKGLTAIVSRTGALHRGVRVSGQQRWPEFGFDAHYHLWQAAAEQITQPWLLSLLRGNDESSLAE
eukprot:932545-Amorphochlora_amoeboformis.AAC.1